jgi:antibiotic biosynthesis monooxygenase (ABM) superfamily enzyme
MFCDTINSYNLEQSCRQHRRYLLSNNSQLTESQIFQLQDEQFATWFKTHVSPITNSLSLAM